MKARKSSGGARVALRLALGYPDVFHGALLNAGSDPIGTLDVPLPPADLFRRFQESTRLVYLTGERDEENLGRDVDSRRSLDKWCAYDVLTQTEPRTGHELADASAFSRSLEALLGERHTVLDNLRVYPQIRGIGYPPAAARKLAVNRHDIAGVDVRIADVMQRAADFRLIVQHRPEGCENSPVSRQDARVQIEYPLERNLNHGSLENRTIPDAVQTTQNAHGEHCLLRQIRKQRQQIHNGRPDVIRGNALVQTMTESIAVLDEKRTDAIARNVQVAKPHAVAGAGRH
jgi:pimeloyl-ACP methyl ester carboxylesterase